MKVWIIEATEPLPDIDGNSRDLRCSILSKALLAHGHEVIWWNSTFNHVTKQHRFDGPRSTQIQPGLRLNLLHGPGYAKNISVGRVRHHMALAQAFEQEIGHYQAKPDLLFACLPIPELAERAVIYGQTHGIPVVIDARDQWPDLYLNVFPSVLRSLARLAITSEFQRTERIFQAATGITAVSETYLQWALNYARRDKQSRDGVFPLGYPAPDTSKQLEIERRMLQLQAEHQIFPDYLVVTFLGMFGASYDLETVVKAARVLQNEGNSKIQIVLGGDGDRSSQLRRMAQGLQNVIFTGWLDQISLLALMRLSSVGLAAYAKDAPQSLPNKLFEYMAAGLPILSSLRGEQEKLLRDKEIGIQYQAGDVASLIKGIRWFSANKDSRTAMGIRAKELFKKTFSTEAVYSQLIKYLEKFVVY
jgi:glycosyltransferase involved in cell wall biosynthesis